MQMDRSLANEYGMRFGTVRNIIPDINFGGCGFFALEAFDLLSSHGFSPKIIYLSSDSEDINLYDSIIEEFNNLIFNKKKPEDIIVPNHCCIKVGKYYFDAGNMAEEKDEEFPFSPITLAREWYPIGEVSRDQLKRALRFRSYWNSYYIRNYNNKILKRVMKNIHKDMAIIIKENKNV